MSEPVWIVYASCGKGHYFPALAASKLLEKNGISCRLVDILDYSKTLKIVYGGSYNFIVKYTPFLWNIIYKLSSIPGVFDKYRVAIERFFLRGFVKDLKTRNPPAVIFTHFILSEILDQTDKKEQKWFCIITDLGVHRFWVNKFVDRYFVGTDETSRKLEAYGIDSRRITISGIPVREKFLTRMKQREIPDADTNLFINITIFKRHEIKDLLYFLKDKGFRGFILCGREKNYYRTASKILGGRFRILLYREDIYQFMKKADVIVTKPGGSTLSEVLVMGKFPVMLNILGGQELYNIRLLKKYNIGLEIKNVSSLVRALTYLQKHPEKLDVNKENIRNFYSYYPETIVKEIKEIYDS